MAQKTNSSYLIMLAINVVLAILIIAALWFLLVKVSDDITDNASESGSKPATLITDNAVQSQSGAISDSKDNSATAVSEEQTIKNMITEQMKGIKDSNDKLAQKIDKRDKELALLKKQNGALKLQEKKRAQKMKALIAKQTDGKIGKPIDAIPNDEQVAAQTKLIQKMISEQMKGIRENNAKLEKSLAKRDGELKKLKIQNSVLAQQLKQLDGVSKNLMARFEGASFEQISSTDKNYLQALTSVPANAAEAPKPESSDKNKEKVTALENRLKVTKNNTGSADSKLQTRIDTLMNEQNTTDSADKVSTTQIASANPAVKTNIPVTNNQSAQDKTYLESLKTLEKERENETRWVTVKAGDTLSLIAQRAYGELALYPKIFEANPELLNDANLIFPGQRLVVPL